jgi:pimeloyl-ACP methyl ester carboxylesterase
VTRTAPRRPRRVIAVVAGLAAASVALSGCLYAMIPESRPAPTLTPDTDGVPAELLPYYDQELEWEPCGEGFDCTTVRAPLDWENPGDADIELAVIRHAATGQSQGALFTNPGGPGVSGKSYVADSLSFAVGEELIESFDVVGFDPRGVGDSTAVRCYDDAGMDAFLFDIPEAPRGSEEWTAEVIASSEAFAQACDANSDGILPYITTENSARDLDLLRAVLGESELTYLGYSYGTYLGAQYAELFPDRVGRLVLDGALDPTISMLELGVVQTIGFERALRAYMENCLADDECPFRGTVDEALSDLNALFASLDRSPLPSGDERLFGADALETAISTALYAREYWDFLTEALRGVLQGDPEIAWYLVDAYFDRQDGVYLSNLIQAFTAYNCMDYPIDWTPEEEAAADDRLRAEAPTIAEYNIGPNLCRVWPYESTNAREPLTAEGAAPIVVVGTTNDPATPYEWSVALADQLSSGVLVTRVGEGHTGYNKGNECVDSAVETYLLEGTVPEDGLRCD